MIKRFPFVLLIFLAASFILKNLTVLHSLHPWDGISWNTFQTNISEELVKGIADVMISSGMKDAGYSYIVLDDGWMTMERDPKTGDLIADPKKFPHGMKSAC